MSDRHAQRWAWPWIAVWILMLLFPKVSNAQDTSGPKANGWDTLTIVDAERDRPIPIAIMRPNSATGLQRVVFISHGYNANLPGTYLLFSGIAKGLADAGFTVVSVQHELPGDELLPMKGDLRILRRPNWERGVQNLRHVLHVLREREPTWPFDRIDLIGHSNGGDISMLYATLHPEEVRSATSLDNRRMPLPRVSRPHIATLRADDVPADPGVLPSEAEQKTFHIDVIPMPGFRHVDFNDRATPEQRSELVRVLLEVLGKADRPDR
ncbi:MAG: alpha/beta hydrolase [Flavobacteriales bacterium]|nr:alpha/beta hydrolase [Flavobacteriales bacterium]